eukprot:XP_019920606.1 PREDICTED: uncharacterized protein LOC109617954 [Crassostrea gigas]
MVAFENVSEHSSGSDQPYCMSYSLFMIHIACSSAIFVIGVIVNVFSIRAIIRLKLFRDTSVIFTLHLMTVNLVACTLGMVVAVVNSIRSTGIKDTSCRSRRKVGGISKPDPTNKKKNSNERQLIISVIIMVTSYTILFLPTCILPVADPNYSLGIYVHVIFTYFMSSSNIIETLIYSILHSKIRNAIKLIMMCRQL